MALRTILEFPDPRLRTVAKPVTEFDEDLQSLVSDMAETMYEANGVGLAATQVNVHQRVIVIDTSEERDQLQIFINPEFTVLDEDLHSYQEGCLSVPTFYEDIERPKHIEVTAFNEKGEQFTLQPEGLLAVCIQHEIDHLNGKLFVDHISAMKRNRIKSKMEKIHKQQRSAK